MKHILYTLLLIMLSVSCTTADGDKRPSLAVTIEPYRFIVEAVAGNGWQVHSVVPSGASRYVG